MTRAVMRKRLGVGACKECVVVQLVIIISANPNWYVDFDPSSDSLFPKLGGNIIIVRRRNRP